MLRKGFSIIEWLFSFVLILLILTYVFQATVVMNKSLLKVSKRSYKCSELCSAFDMVVRHIYSAPFAVAQWKQLNTYELVWYDQASHADIGCKMEKGKVFIIKGLYKNGSWSKKRKNLIARDVHRFEFYPHYVKKDSVGSIRCVLQAECEGKIYKFERIVCIKNGVV